MVAVARVRARMLQSNKVTSCCWALPALEGAQQHRREEGCHEPCCPHAGPHATIAESQGDAHWEGWAGSQDPRMSSACECRDTPSQVHGMSTPPGILCPACRGLVFISWHLHLTFIESKQKLQAVIAERGVCTQPPTPSTVQIAGPQGPRRGHGRPAKERPGA